ncbi:hypothetical protein AVEN_135295-1 [Araneus ventricosus]|uniref:Uncharacterized protein n=1 Tax=Araneus ventricosus TaxID=182803 RepID=A0A4Y2CQ79_ARAVE|nr:hypothetical protein AVEN_135295-1 [Araneus ventricosus]
MHTHLYARWSTTAYLCCNVTLNNWKDRVLSADSPNTHGLPYLPICHLVTFRSGDFRSHKCRDKLPSMSTSKDAIHQHVSALPQAMLLNAVNGVMCRLTAVLLNNDQIHEQLQAYL